VFDVMVRHISFYPSVLAIRKATFSHLLSDIGGLVTHSSVAKIQVRGRGLMSGKTYIRIARRGRPQVRSSAVLQMIGREVLISPMGGPRLMEGLLIDI